MADFKPYPQYEIDEIVKIMDYILEHQGQNITVADIKAKFNLSREQYNMVYDLCLALIRRWSSNEGYWNARYRRLKSRISVALRNDKCETAIKIRDVLSTDNELAKKLKKQFHAEEGESVVPLFEAEDIIDIEEEDELE